MYVLVFWLVLGVSATAQVLTDLRLPVPFFQLTPFGQLPPGGDVLRVSNAASGISTLPPGFREAGQTGFTSDRCQTVQGGGGRCRPGYDSLCVGYTTLAVCGSLRGGDLLYCCPDPVSQQTLVRPGQTLVQSEQTLVQPGQTLVQPEQTLVQPGQTLVQPEQTLVQPDVETLTQTKVVTERPAVTEVVTTTEVVTHSSVVTQLVTERNVVTQVVTERPVFTVTLTELVQETVLPFTSVLLPTKTLVQPLNTATLEFVEESVSPSTKTLPPRTFTPIQSPISTTLPPVKTIQLPTKTLSLPAETVFVPSPGVEPTDPSSCGSPGLGWVALVGTRQRWTCSGALVAPRLLMTAARCVTGRPATSLAVRLGERDLRSGADGRSVDAAVVRVISHPGAADGRHDLALLLLSTDGGTSPVCWPDDSGAISNLRTLGWGISPLSATPALSSTLTSTDVRQMATTDCDAIYRLFPTYRREFPDGVGGTEVCVAAEGPVAADSLCPQDRGGALVGSDQVGRVTLVGVMREAAGCGSDVLPGLYTRLRPYLPWMRQVRAQVA